MKNKLTFSIFFISLILLLSKCGGGTIGTDSGGSTRIAGSLASLRGTGIAGANVTIGETGDSAITDSTGAFAIESVLDDQVVTFLVESKGANSATQITDIPPNPLEVSVKLVLNQSTNKLTVQSQQVHPRPTPRPTPTRKPRRTPASATPTPDPMITPGKPTRIPTPTNTPRSTKTPSATATPTATPVSFPITIIVRDLGFYFQTASIKFINIDGSILVDSFSGDGSVASAQISGTYKKKIGIKFITGTGPGTFSYQGNIVITGNLSELTGVTIDTSLEISPSTAAPDSLNLNEVTVEPGGANTPNVKVPSSFSVVENP